MATNPAAPAAPCDTARSAPRRAVWLTVMLGHAPALAALGGVALMTLGASGGEPATRGWLLAATLGAAAATVAGAWRTLAALRRAERTDAPHAAPSGSRTDAAAADCAMAARIEIDHKVRNTLQVVTSLLSLELRRAGPSGERAALMRVQARLHSLSLVHRRSSTLDAAAGTRLDLIAAEIADHLFAEAPTAREPPTLRLALDAVSAPPERAAAFALFVNEALMTARDRLERTGGSEPVAVSLRAFGAGACLLSIGGGGGALADGGARADPLGARLMANCAAQLGATLSMGKDEDPDVVRLAIPPQAPT